MAFPKKEAQDGNDPVASNESSPVVSNDNVSQAEQEAKESDSASGEGTPKAGTVREGPEPVEGRKAGTPDGEPAESLESYGIPELEDAPLPHECSLTEARAIIKQLVPIVQDLQQKHRRDVAQQRRLNAELQKLRARHQVGFS